jgi:hypothetical protein
LKDIFALFPDFPVIRSQSAMGRTLRTNLKVVADNARHTARSLTFMRVRITLSPRSNCCFERFSLISVSRHTDGICGKDECRAIASFHVAVWQNVEADRKGSRHGSPPFHAGKGEGGISVHWLPRHRPATSLLANAQGQDYTQAQFGA